MTADIILPATAETIADVKASLSEQGRKTLIADSPLGMVEGFIADETVFGEFLEGGGQWGDDVTSLVGQALAGWGDQAISYIDIGANIGLTSLPFIGRVQNHYAVEADPDNGTLLEQNLCRNGGDQITILRTAVADKAGQLTFEKDQNNFGDHRLRSGKTALSDEEFYDEAGRQTITVNTAPLDDLIPLPAPDDGKVIVKIDIQGAEPLAFRGGDKFFTRTDLLLMEYWPYGLARMGEDEAAFQDLVGRYFSFGQIIWPHDPGAPLCPNPLSQVWQEIHDVYSGGDSLLHKVGCLNLALTKKADPFGPA